VKRDAFAGEEDVRGAARADESASKVYLLCERSPAVCVCRAQVRDAT